MAPADKPKKTKKADAAPDAAPAAEEKRGSSKKAKRSGSNVFAMFNQRQIAEFKEGFAVMDVDKDGIIGKGDLRATFEAYGKTPNDREIDEMLSEPTGPLNFTQLLQLFGSRLEESGGADDDEAITNAFKTFDSNGKIDTDAFKTALMTFGEKMSAQEVKEVFGQLPMDGNAIDTAKLLVLLTGGGGEEAEQ